MLGALSPRRKWTSADVIVLPRSSTQLRGRVEAAAATAAAAGLANWPLGSTNLHPDGNQESSISPPGVGAGLKVEWAWLWSRCERRQ